MAGSLPTGYCQLHGEAPPCPVCVEMGVEFVGFRPGRVVGFIHGATHEEVRACSRCGALIAAGGHDFEIHERWHAAHG